MMVDVPVVGLRKAMNIQGSTGDVRSSISVMLAPMPAAGGG